jgi:beta-lactamase class A
MAYGSLRERQHGLQLPVLEILSALLLLGGIVLGMIELVRYSSVKDALPTDLTCRHSGGRMDGTRPGAPRPIYMNQPITLYCLQPDPVIRAVSGFASTATRCWPRRARTAKRLLGGFLNYWDPPVAAVSPLNADYVPSDLRLFLASVAERYDEPDRGPPGSLGTLTSCGHGSDIAQAAALIDQALYDLDVHRQVVLPLVTAEPARQDGPRPVRPGIDAEPGPLITGRRRQQACISNLNTGQELSIQGDMAFSAMSTIKIPIMINVFRSKLTMDQDTAYLLTESLLCSNNASSNLLMQSVGLGGDANAMLGDGLNQVSCTTQALGADHTYISAPLWVGAEGPRGEWPVCRPDPAAAASVADDPYSQTTPEDMGTLLAEIYDCANHDSGLRAIYPDDITQTECQQMLNLLSSNHIDRLLELGVPPGTHIAHKNGWGPPGTSGDAGIVFSPGADYIVVMYTWEADTDGNGLPTIASWELIEEVSRLVWNYFNPDAALYQRREPILPYTAINCVTVSPEHPEWVDLNDVNAHRVDDSGVPLPEACYGGATHYNSSTGTCLPWDDWGRAVRCTPSLALPLPGRWRD